MSINPYDSIYSTKESEDVFSKHSFLLLIWKLQRNNVVKTDVQELASEEVWVLF
jgi:hypothetical protein